jgi:molybdopterin/thiamine biosynthesis adenylyltransferase
MNLDLVYSRPTRTAAQLADHALDRHRILAKKVLLMGEPDTLQTTNGRNCFIDSTGLLVRICPNITLHIPPSCADLRAFCGRFSERIAFGPGVEYRDHIDDFDSFDAILSVGSAVKPSLPWTTINSNGWLARVSSGTHELSPNCAMDNPVGALAAACLGVGEVFKRLIRLRPERGDFLDGLEFSLRTYRSCEEECGPELPSCLDLDFLLVGAGAIGNGIARLLSQLSCCGRIDIVDPQSYGEENLGTCILMGADDLGASKAKTLAAHLRGPRLDARAFVMPFEEYAQEACAIPAVVLNGLDNISARHQVQREFWPDLIVDGAIGDFTCQVSRHPWPDDVACLLCLFREPSGTAAETLQKQATGLSFERLSTPDAFVSASDVDKAPGQNQDFLRSRIGRPICSVIQEGIALKISFEQQQRGFEPSVPFTACFSACMVVAEAIAHVMKWPSILAPRFQFDFLTGPAYGQELPQGRRTNCICARRTNIERARTARTQKAALHFSEGPIPGQSPRPESSSRKCRIG